MNNISIMFNMNKIKYDILNMYFEENVKKTNIINYFFIDLDFILAKYMYASECSIEDFNEEASDLFILEILNLISHYKRFFCEKINSNGFFYIGIPVKKYKKYKILNDMIVKLNKLLTVIPKIYVYYYEDDHYNYWLKYNLIKNICFYKQGSNITPIIFDLGKIYRSELFYILTKNYHIFRYEGNKPYLYSFNDFKKEYLSDIEDIYLNSIISLLPVYETLSFFNINKKVRIDDIMLKFIKKHPRENFNSSETQQLLLKTFSSSKKLEKKLNSILHNMNSYVYSNMSKTVMENWKHVIKDNSIYRINEALKIPDDKRVNIEILMKY